MTESHRFKQFTMTLHLSWIRVSTMWSQFSKFPQRKTATSTSVADVGGKNIKSPTSCKWQSVTVMLVTSLCWWLFPLCWWFSQYLKSVTYILNRSPTSQTCHQHIWSPTSVTNIDVTSRSSRSLLDTAWRNCNQFCYKQAVLSKTSSTKGSFLK